MKKLRRILIIILIPIIGVASYGIYKYKSIDSKIEKIQIDKSHENLKISEETEVKSKELNIYNFIIFGLDRRNEEDAARSDSIIIATVDEKHNSIKLSSIMRDTYVPIEGHGMTKINHAYAYGGAELAMSTINSNFDMNIKEYVSVNFWDVVKIIDLIGGVSIDIQSNEVKFIDGIKKAGTYNLNGKQALAYSRIRYTTGGDYVRTDRQRTVLTSMFNKIMSLSNKEKYDLIPKIAENIETSMENDYIFTLATSVMTNNITNIKQMRYPTKGKGQKKSDGIYYLVADLEQMKSEIKEFILN